MQETLHQIADAGVSPSDSGCRRHSIRQRIQEILYHTADAGDSIKQRMQETFYQTADARVSPSDSGCRRRSIREPMQETLYQTADVGVSLSDSGCTLSDRETPAQTV